MVAIDTTPEDRAARKQSLTQWLNRTQEVLAHRSLQGQTFTRLHNLMRTKRLVEVALDNVLANAGARTAGIDGITKADLAADETRNALINEVQRELNTKTYRPRPVRRVYIPKPNGDKRPLGIPTIKDRVVQEMLRLILEPIYECKFYAHSYGFRPFRSAHHAAVRIHCLIGNHHYNYAIEGDIRKCFDRIHHLKLIAILRQTIKDERIIRLVKDMLKAGVMEDGLWHATDEGTPQGGIVSPLLANIYLNELDQYIMSLWGGLPDTVRESPKRSASLTPCFIVRYADDFVVLVRGTREQAERLKAQIAEFLDHQLHLELSAEKTAVTAVEEGIDFLGFTIRRYPRGTLIIPSQKAMRRFRDKVKQIAWEGFGLDDRAAIALLNRYLTGWGMYYRRVSSAQAFRKADYYVWHRVFRTSYCLRNPQLGAREHYKAHYIPYRFDIYAPNRRHGGRNYGAWADKAHTRAYIVTSLKFFPIRYVRLYPQLNPYVPAERAELEKRVEVLTPPPDLLIGPEYNPDYGADWPTVRSEVLKAAGHRCNRCGRHITGRIAHVHHRVKRKGFKHRSQANMLDNLIALCSSCHAVVERAEPDEGLHNA